MDERKGGDTYSRDWRTRFPWLKLKARAWITRNISLGVSSSRVRLWKEDDIRGCAMAIKGAELLERGDTFVFLELLGDENTSYAGGNLRPLPQYLPRDHL